MRSYGHLLQDRGFLAFMATQFLGAVNDYFYRFAVTYFALAEAARRPDNLSATGLVTLIGLLSILPFLLFSPLAGQWADRSPKRSVLIAAKFLEIPAMAIGLCAFIFGDLSWLLAALFLMFVQSALFSPAKYGILPEILVPADLARGNALIELATFLAILLGSVLGGYAFAWWQDNLVVIGVAALTIAVLGFALAFGIPAAPGIGRPGSFAWNPFPEMRLALQELYGRRDLRRIAIGLCWFWFMGALVQAVIPLHGQITLGRDPIATGWLLAIVATGIGVGSLLAGGLAKGGLGETLVPIALAMIGFSAVLPVLLDSFALAIMACAGLGLGGGLYAVPLNALLQRLAPEGARGRMIAAVNILTMLAVLGANLFNLALGDLFGASPALRLATAGAASLGLVAWVRRIVRDLSA